MPVKTPTKPSFKPVEAVARALKVLRVVSEERQATVASIHRKTGLDKATIVRMLETLHHEGYVAKETERAQYSVTARTLLLSQGYEKSRWIAGVAEPSLARFRNSIGWPSDIAVFDVDAMVVLQTSRESGGPLSFNRRPGFRSPMLATSIGIAYLAFCPTDECQRIIRQLAAVDEPWNQLAREPERLNALLERTRKDGFAVMNDDYSEQVFAGNVWAMGVPVVHKGELFAALNVMMLKKALTLSEARKQILAPLRQVADDIATQLAAARD
ncbi:helix-turn-helix domain-containing protein [Pseudomonas putida]|nr:IclR family transcriptional regulator C-terminal domain-containing protein [Pseudomonas putida]MCI1025558.1 helix-turn-helix domain-containing protein [Pseudomonas putida]